jgi:signal transduction histidine kinase
VSADKRGPRDLPPAAVEAIERVQREKDEFLSLVAHELKTPLTPLKTVAQLIRMRIRRAREGTRALDIDALEKNAAMIERQVDRMDRIVTDLLEVSRAARDRFVLRPAPFDLAELAREVVGGWSEDAEETEREALHRFEIDAPASLPVVGDKDRVEQVLGNLLGNAVKFSPSGGLVRVEVRGGDGTATVTVHDEGIGIPPGEIGMLGREPFTTRERTKDYAGLGIGLYLTRLVAEGHGGRLELASEGQDRGTTATLTLKDLPTEEAATTTL